MKLGVAAGARERCGVGDFARRLVAVYPPDIEVVSIDTPAGGGSAAWRRAARAAQGVDVVHVHYEYGLFETVKPYRNLYAVFVEELRPPVVVTLHGPLPSLESRWCSGRRGVADLLRDLAYLPFFARWDRIMQRGVAHWIVHSRSLCDQIEAAAGSDRSTYLPHPIPEVAHTWQPSTRGRLVMVTPGFVKPHKGYHELAKAMGTDWSWSWIIAGGPQDRRDRDFLRVLRDTLVSRRIEDRVRFTGYLDRGEMEATLCGAGLAVFPYAEVFGSGSVAWAIGCGLPVVTTDLPEFVEMKSDGAGIELLPVGATDRWAEIVRRLWSEPARLAAMARQNRAYAVANSFVDCALAHAEIFARVVDEVGA